MNVPIKIHKDIGVGSCSNLGIESLGDETASCLCARYYKGLSQMNANAVLVGGVDDIVEFLKTKRKYEKGVCRSL